MTHITSSDLARLSKLAKLRFNEQEQEKLLVDLTEIFGIIDELNKIDTKGIEPLVNITNHPAPMRDDEITDGNVVEKILSNAKDTEFNCFTVPKVVE